LSVLASIMLMHRCSIARLDVAARVIFSSPVVFKCEALLKDPQQVCFRYPICCSLSKPDQLNLKPHPLKAKFSHIFTPCTN